MKKSTIFIIGLLLIGKICFSQAAIIVLIFGDKVASENFYFSVKGGINLSSTPGISPSDTKLGYHFGLVANVKLGEKLYFAPEFLPLNMKGSRNLYMQVTGVDYLDSINLSSASLSRQLNYIDIPLFFRYEFNNSFSLQAGPQFSFLTGASNFYENTSKDENNFEYTYDLQADHKWYDIGLGIGLGYVVSKQKNGKAMEVHVRYTIGLIDIHKGTQENYRNSVFQISAIFPFQLDETVQ